MTDYINKDLALDIVKRTSGDYATAWCNILKLPVADVVPIKHGKWILEREPDGTPYCFHCSICDDDFHYIGIKTVFDYCPNKKKKRDLKSEPN